MLFRSRTAMFGTWCIADTDLALALMRLIAHQDPLDHRLVTYALAQFDRKSVRRFVAHQIARARRGRDIMCRALAATGRCRFAVPMGAFYLLFAVDGETDTRGLALRLIDEAGVGLAPGTAFGAGGEGFLRLCFARNAEQLETAGRRLTAALSR